MVSDPGEALIGFALGDVAPSARAHRVVEMSLADWAACGIAGFEEGTFTHWVAQQGAPGQNPRPLPVSTMTRTSSSALAAFMHS